MSTEITDAELAELRRLHEAADRAPWYLVGHPWADGRAADTYAISGSPDPHARTAVLQWCEVDEVTLRDGDDESSAWRDAEDKQRANLACAVAARNALPALLSRLERAEKEAKESYLRGKTDGANEEHSLNWRRENERIKALEKERDEARENVDAWAEKEAACCPEDVGFPEYIAVLTKRVATLEAALRECEDYFDQRADADCAGDPAAYAGNREMTLLGIVRRALRGLEGK